MTSTIDIQGTLTFWSLAEYLPAGEVARVLGEEAAVCITPAQALKCALAESMPTRLIRRTKESGEFTVVAEDRGHEENRYQNVFSAKVNGGGRVHFGSGDLDSTTRYEIDACYSRYCAATSAGRLGAVLAKWCVEKYNGTTLRPSGGVYWLPPWSARQFSELADAIEAIKPLSEKPSVIYRISHDLEPQNLRAVYDGIVAEATSEIARLRDDIDSGALGERALEQRRLEAARLGHKLIRYEAVTGGSLEQLRVAVIECETAAATAALMAAATPKSE